MSVENDMQKLVERVQRDMKMVAARATEGFKPLRETLERQRRTR